MKIFILFFMVIFIWAFPIHSQWTPQVVTAHWTLTSFDEAKYVKVKGGFVYVTGNCSDNNSSGSLYALMTIKYDLNLNLVWTAIYPGSTGQQNPVTVSGIDIDNFGNVYIAGTQYNGSNDDYLTVKYNIGGTQQWALTYDNGGEDVAHAIGVDNDGNVYITGGSFDNLVPFYPNTHTTTISYFPSGGSPRWVKRYWQHENLGCNPPNPNDPRCTGVHQWYSEAYALTIDNVSGLGRHQGVYVAGWVDDGLNCGGDCLMDASVVYYDFRGNNESAGWYGCGGPHPLDGPGNDFAKAVVVSASTGDVFCTGAKWCGEDCSVYPTCNPSYNHLSNYEVFTARFSWNIPGSVGRLWVDGDYCDNARYEGKMDGGQDEGTSLVVDDAPGHDYVYAAGFTQQKPVSDILQRTSGNTTGGDIPDGYRDYITLKYDHYVPNSRGQGVKLWCTDCHPDPIPEKTCPIVDCPQIYNSGGVANDIANSIAIDAAGTNVFVTGIAGNPDQHIVTIQYNSSGSQVCFGEYHDQIGAIGNSIAVDGSNPAQVYVAGVTKNFQYFYDFVVLKYVANNCTNGTNPVNLQTQKLKGIPENFNLSQNYPNPFNPTTSIKYSIPRASYISLKIYNALGQRVINISSKYLEAGYYSENIDASSLSSGIYFYEIQARDASNQAVIFTDTKKMMFIK